MEPDPRVTTAVVGLLIAFCAVLLFKWLALVAVAAVVVIGVLRFAVRRLLRAIRARRTAGEGAPAAAADPAPVVVLASGPPCSWCGLVGGHHDLHGRPVRPRHAHALPAPSYRAS
ncbi:hypothetical protein [Actinomycetospora sp. NBRC 106375]|uniref:hypothetical protein n=1 Tax=Actinomycetospora sp. NBRC 106375 TaxID=3032207 RepID=UPI0025531356|nr:hypothetical protein [Actinomycetospora sp. NBRC 106375]